MVERKGDAFELGAQLTVVGAKLGVGVEAPDFELDHLVPASDALETIRLRESAGHVRVLNVINSLDTPVCQIETRRWDAELLGISSGVELFTISMDLPFAQARWCAAENARHAALSAHREEDFGRNYGVLIKEWRLLQRAVFVVGGEGRIEHAEYVADQMAEPDYDAAITVVRRLLGSGVTNRAVTSG